MSSPAPRRIDDRVGAVALLVCGLIGIVIGVGAGLSLARRMAQPPTEARSAMQLLQIEHKSLAADAARGKCSPIARERLDLLFALIDVIPVSVRDTLVVDAAFEREVERLRNATRALTASSPSTDCNPRRVALESMDRVCRDCHREFRAGG